jgi:hypothetical protein
MAPSSAWAAKSDLTSRATLSARNESRRERQYAAPRLVVIAGLTRSRSRCSATPRKHLGRLVRPLNWLLVEWSGLHVGPELAGWEQGLGSPTG